MTPDPRELAARARKAARAFAHQEGVEATLFEDLATALEQALERVGALKQANKQRHEEGQEMYAELARLTTRYQELKEKARIYVNAVHKYGPDSQGTTKDKYFINLERALITEEDK